MANNNFLDSLFRTAFQEIKRSSGPEKSDFKKEFQTLYEKYYLESETNSVNQLCDSYRNIFDASNEGQIFVQNGRFNNEFICSADDESDMIGFGSFGDVFKAKHKYDEHIYAIKRQQFLRPDEFSSNQMNKLLRELKVNAKIKYDYLLQYKSFWFESDKKIAQLYIQMELCAMDLKNVVKLSEKISPHILHLFVISNIFQEIMIGVKYLHSCQIIHRDLKPANILVTNGENGRFIKIADFGFAVFHDTPEMSHSKDKGTADYTAPEVKSGNYDTLADIFSLGMVLAKITNFLFKNNKTDSDRTLYDSKLNSLKLLQTKMIDHMAKSRPTCERILQEEKSWLLTMNEVKNMDKFKTLMRNCNNVYDINKTFFEYFTFEKLKSINVSLLLRS